MTTYAEFRLRIERGPSRRSYRVVASGPGGEAVGRFRLPFSDSELEIFILRVARTRRGVRRLDSPEMEQAKEFGTKLFGALFEDEVRELFRTSFNEARNAGQGLRISLSLTSVPELLRVPWEYLYDRPRFPSTSTWTPIVRYLDLPRPHRPLRIDLPLRILGVVSAPTDAEPIDVQLEKTKLEDALAPLIAAKSVAIDWLEEASLAALQEQLGHAEYHIFHYVGHGGYDAKAGDGLLLFEDEHGRGREVTGFQLATILDNEISLRLAVLNACEGARSSLDDPFAGVATSLIEHEIPAVIGMQFEITDRAAILFAGAFYTALARGQPVDTAVTEARLRIFADHNDIEWGTPVLFMRVADGRLFELTQPSTVPAPPIPPEVEAGVADATLDTETAERERLERERLRREADAEEAGRLEQERLRREREEAERLEEARLRAEAEEAERLKRAALEQKQAERDRQAAIEAERERRAAIDAEREAERKREEALEAEREAQERRRREAEAKRIEEERRRHEAEEKVERERQAAIERERVAGERRRRRQRIAAGAVAVAALGLAAFFVFVVLPGQSPSITVSASRSGVPDEVEVNGRGFEPREIVDLTINSTPVGTPTAAFDGTIRTDVKVPGAAPFLMSAAGRTSGRTATRSFVFVVGVVPSPSAQASKARGILFYSNVQPGSTQDDNEIYTIDPVTKDVDQLTDNDVEDTFPTWSPDRSQIAFARGDTGSRDIFVMNADGGIPQVMFGGPGDDWFPAWSTKDDWLAFVRQGASNTSEIWLNRSDPNRPDEHVVAISDIDRRIRSPAWSPNGDLLAFWGNATSDNDDVYVVHPDGKLLVNLTNNPATDRNPTWSPDGKTIAFISDRDRKRSASEPTNVADYDVYLVDVDTKRILRRLTDNDVQDGNPVWSPDGKQIAFYRAFGDGFHILVINVDGTGELDLMEGRAGRNLDPNWR